MKNSDLEIKGRKLRKEEALLLLASALTFEDCLEEREYYKNGTFTLTQQDMAAALFIFGKKIMALYASGSLDKTVAESRYKTPKRVSFLVDNQLVTSLLSVFA